MIDQRLVKLARILAVVFLAAFAAAGGSLACLYNLSSGPGNGGFFGVVESGSWNFIRQRLARQTPTG